MTPTTRGLRHKNSCRGETLPLHISKTQGAAAGVALAVAEYRQKKRGPILSVNTALTLGQLWRSLSEQSPDKRVDGACGF